MCHDGAAELGYAVSYLRTNSHKLQLRKGRRAEVPALCRCQLQLSTALTFVVSDDDLDWEFVFDSHFGHPTGSSEEPMVKRSKKRCEELPILHPDAAGIDVGASELFVAVSADRDHQPVRSFTTFTRDLNALADWLQ